MDNKEADILQILSNKSNISQREIAKKSNLSLGMVNTLIKKCVKKGLVKIERLNPRSARYILTPKGIEEKTKKTLRYISKSYKAIKMIRDKVDSITKIQKDKNNRIIILGSKDEMREIIVQSLNEINVSYKSYYNTKELDTIKETKDIIIYLWEVDYENQIKSKKYEYINILK